MGVSFLSRAKADGPAVATPATARLSVAPAGRPAARLKTWRKINPPLAGWAGNEVGQVIRRQVIEDIALGGELYWGEPLSIVPGAFSHHIVAVPAALDIRRSAVVLVPRAMDSEIRQRCQARRVTGVGNG